MVKRFLTQWNNPHHGWMCSMDFDDETAARTFCGILKYMNGGRPVRIRDLQEQKIIKLL